MPQYKLTYFDGRGRAEPARLLFALAGQKFEDKRINKEEWGALKSTTPYGGLPILEVDGIVLAQSNAIYRFLARQFGYAGKDDTEAALVDMMADCILDIFTGFAGASKASNDDTEKAENIKKYIAEKLPIQLNNIEKLFGSDGWLVGNKISWADVVWFNVVKVMFPMFKAEVDLKDYPKVAKLADNVAKQPGIAEWLQKYP